MTVIEICGKVECRHVMNVRRRYLWPHSLIGQPQNSYEHVLLHKLEPDIAATCVYLIMPTLHLNLHRVYFRISLKRGQMLSSKF